MARWMLRKRPRMLQRHASNRGMDLDLELELDAGFL